MLLSVSVGGRVVVLGGREMTFPEVGSNDREQQEGSDDRDEEKTGLDIFGFEEFDPESDTWVPKPEWEMGEGRYRYDHLPCFFSSAKRYLTLDAY